MQENSPDWTAHWNAFRAFLQRELGLLGDEAERRLENRQDLAAAVPEGHFSHLVRGLLKDHPRKPQSVMEACLVACVPLADLKEPLGNAPELGFRRAVSRLSSLLARHGLIWQSSELMTGGREFRIREYSDFSEERLPDEHFDLVMRVLDEAAIAEARAEKIAAWNRLEQELRLLTEVCEVKPPWLGWRATPTTYADWLRMTSGARKKRPRTSNPLWEASLTGTADPSAALGVEAGGRQKNFADEISWVRQGLELLEKFFSEAHLRDLEAAAILRERAEELAGSVHRFELGSNPFLFQPGLLVEIHCTSEKRRRYTLEHLSRSLSDFLALMSRGFATNLPPPFQGVPAMGPNGVRGPVPPGPGVPGGPMARPMGPGGVPAPGTGPRPAMPGAPRPMAPGQAVPGGAMRPAPPAATAMAIAPAASANPPPVPNGNPETPQVEKPVQSSNGANASLPSAAPAPATNEGIDSNSGNPGSPEPVAESEKPSGPAVKKAEGENPAAAPAGGSAPTGKTSSAPAAKILPVGKKAPSPPVKPGQGVKPGAASAPKAAPVGKAAVASGAIATAGSNPGGLPPTDQAALADGATPVKGAPKAPTARKPKAPAGKTNKAPEAGAPPRAAPAAVPPVKPKTGSAAGEFDLDEL